MKNSKFKKILSLFLALIIVLGTIPASVVSVGAADNAGGIATGGSSGKWNATYRKDESMWKVSVYIAKKDTTTVTNSKISDWHNISDGKEIIIYTDENEATLAESACFGKMSKIDYLSENSEIENASVEFVPLKNKNDNTYNFIEILDTSAPEVPIDGNSSTLSDVKAYFAQKETLEKLLQSIAGGTSKADVLRLFADKSFTIDGYTKKGSEWEGKTDINGDKITLYPTSENGTIKSAMEFLIVYEPIVVQHFGSGIKPSGGGSTYYNVSCFTATELSIFRAQGSSLGDLMHLPTYVAKAVHLEKDWLGYKKSANNDYSKEDSRNSTDGYHQFVYECGGWGMRNAGNFNNLVGDYSVSVSVNQNNVQAGGKVTVTWTVKNYTNKAATIPLLLYARSSNPKGGHFYYNLYDFASENGTMPIKSDWSGNSSFTKFAENAEKNKAYVNVTLKAGSKSNPTSKTITKTIQLDSNFDTNSSFDFCGVINRKAKNNETNPGFSNWNSGWGNNYSRKTINVPKDIEVEPTITVNLIDKTNGNADIAGKRFSVWCIGASTMNSNYTCSCGDVTTGISGSATKTCSKCGKEIKYRGYELFPTSNQTNVGFAGIIETDENGQATINLADYTVTSDQSADGTSNTNASRTATGVARTFNGTAFQWTPTSFINGGSSYKLWDIDKDKGVSRYQGNLVTFENPNETESTTEKTAGDLSQRYRANRADSADGFYPTTRYLRETGLYGTNLSVLNTISQGYGALIQGGTVNNTKWNWRTGNTITFVIRPIDAADPKVEAGERNYTDSVMYYSYNGKTVETFGYQTTDGETTNKQAALAASNVTYIAKIPNRLQVNGTSTNADIVTSDYYKFKSAVEGAPVNFGFVTIDDNTKLIYEDVLYKHFSYSSDKNAVFNIEIQANPKGKVIVDVTQEVNCTEKEHNVFKEDHNFVLVDSWGQTHFASATETDGTHTATFTGIPDGDYEVFPLIKGDLNFDGAITKEDYELLDEYEDSGLTDTESDIKEKYAITISGEKIYIADISGDGKINNIDKKILERMTTDNEFDLNNDNAFDAADYEYLSEYYAWQTMLNICLSAEDSESSIEYGTLFEEICTTDFYIWFDENDDVAYTKEIPDGADCVTIKDLIIKVDNQEELTELEKGFLHDIFLFYGFNTKLYLFKDSRPIDETTIEAIAKLNETEDTYATYITANDLKAFQNLLASVNGEIKNVSANHIILFSNKTGIDEKLSASNSNGNVESDYKLLPKLNTIWCARLNYLTDNSHFMISESGEDTRFTIHTFTGGMNETKTGATETITVDEIMSDNYAIKLAKVTGTMVDAQTNHHNFEITCRAGVNEIEPIVRVSLHDNTNTNYENCCRHCGAKLKDEITEETECNSCGKKQGTCIFCGETLVEVIDENETFPISYSSISETTTCMNCGKMQIKENPLISGKQFAVYATAIYERGTSTYLNSYGPNNEAYLGTITTDEYGRGALNLAEANENNNNVIYDKICSLYSGLSNEYETPAELFGALFGKNAEGETILKKYRPDGENEIINKIQIVVRPLDKFKNSYTYYSYSPNSKDKIVPFNTSITEGEYTLTEAAPNTGSLFKEKIDEIKDQINGVLGALGGILGGISGAGTSNKKGYGTFTFQNYEYNYEYIDYLGCTFSSSEGVFDKNVDVYINDEEIETVEVEIKNDGTLHENDLGEYVISHIYTIEEEIDSEEETTEILEVVDEYTVEIGDTIKIPLYPDSEYHKVMLNAVDSPYYSNYTLYDKNGEDYTNEEKNKKDEKTIEDIENYTEIVYEIGAKWTFKQKYTLGEGVPENYTFNNLGLKYTLYATGVNYTGTINSSGIASTTISSDKANLQSLNITNLPENFSVSGFTPISADDFKAKWNSSEPYTVTQEFLVDTAIVNVSILADDTIHPNDNKTFTVQFTNNDTGTVTTKEFKINETNTMSVSLNSNYTVKILDVELPYQCEEKSYDIYIGNHITDVTFNLSALWTVVLSYEKDESATIRDNELENIQFYFNNDTAMSGKTDKNGVYVAYAAEALTSLVTTTTFDEHCYSEFEEITIEDFLNSYRTDTPYCVNRIIEIKAVEKAKAGTIIANLLKDSFLDNDDKLSSLGDNVSITLIDENGNKIQTIKNVVSYDGKVIFENVPIGTYSFKVDGVSLPYYMTEIPTVTITADETENADLFYGAKGCIQPCITTSVTNSWVALDSTKNAVVTIYTDASCSDSSIIAQFNLVNHGYSRGNKGILEYSYAESPYLSLEDGTPEVYYVRVTSSAPDCHTYVYRTNSRYDCVISRNDLIQAYDTDYKVTEYPTLISTCKGAFDVAFTGDVDKMAGSTFDFSCEDNNGMETGDTARNSATNFVISGLSLFSINETYDPAVTSYSLNRISIPDYFIMTKEQGNEEVSIKDFRTMHSASHTEYVTYKLTYIYDYSVTVSAPSTVKRNANFNFTVTSNELRGFGDKPTLLIYSDNELIYEGTVDLTNGAVTQTFTAKAPDKGSFTLTAYINWDGKYYEIELGNNKDGKEIATTGGDLWINPVNANLAYYRGEEAIASFIVHTAGENDILNADNVNIKFSLTYPTGTTQKTIALTDCYIDSVVIPGTKTAGEKSENLVSIRFRMPNDMNFNTSNHKAVVTAELNPDKNYTEINYDNNKATIVNQCEYTYENNFEGYAEKSLSKPSGAQYRDERAKEPLTKYNETFNSTSTIIGTKSEWSYWVENNTTHTLFVETYVSEMTLKAIAKTDNRCLTAKYEGNDLHIGSGYALTFAAQPVIVLKKIVNGTETIINIDNTIVDTQFVEVYYPEQSYVLTGQSSTLEKVSVGNNNLGTSQFTATTVALGHDNVHDIPLLRNETRWELPQNTLSSFGPWIEGNEEAENQMKRKHFTPLWYKDGEYNVICDAGHAWTPDGAIGKQTYFATAYGGNIIIDGSVYDDYYTVR